MLNWYTEFISIWRGTLIWNAIKHRTTKLKYLPIAHFFFTILRLRIISKCSNLIYLAFEFNFSVLHVTNHSHQIYELIIPLERMLFHAMLDGFENTSHEYREQHFTPNTVKKQSALNLFVQPLHACPYWLNQIPSLGPTDWPSHIWVQLTEQQSALEARDIFDPTHKIF